MKSFFKHEVLKLSHFAPQGFVWEGDALLDWRSGGDRLFVTGECTKGSVYMPHGFDRAIVSPSKQYSLVFRSNQTKGLLLKDWKVMREINRSYYNADMYEFPAVFAQLSTGEEVLIHCPTAYNRLSVESVQNGTPVIQGERLPRGHDFFHSWMSVGPKAKYLLSVGWVWQPWSTAMLYDFEAALMDATVLDGPGISIPVDDEIYAGVFVSEDELVLNCYQEPDNDGKNDEHYFVHWKIGDKQVLKRFSHSDCGGELHFVPDHFVLSTAACPRLFDYHSGELVYEWSNLTTNAPASCYCRDQSQVKVPYDPVHKRFAVIQGKDVHVITLDVDKLTSKDDSK